MVILSSQLRGGDWVLFPFYFPALQVPCPPLLILILAQASFYYLFSRIRPLSPPTPTSRLLRAFSTLYFLLVELECVGQYFTYRTLFVGQRGGKCFTYLAK